MNPSSPDLAPALLRVATDERFVANLYWTWCGDKLDLDALEKELRAPTRALIKAGLCLRPRGEDVSAAVDKIATYAGIEVATFLAFVRAAEAISVFKRNSQRERFLAAARDARSDDQDE